MFFRSNPSASENSSKPMKSKKNVRLIGEIHRFFDQMIRGLPVAFEAGGIAY